MRRNDETTDRCRRVWTPRYKRIRARPHWPIAEAIIAASDIRPYRIHWSTDVDGTLLLSVRTGAYTLGYVAGPKGLTRLSSAHSLTVAAACCDLIG